MSLSLLESTHYYINFYAYWVALKGFLVCWTKVQQGFARFYFCSLLQNTRNNRQLDNLIQDKLWEPKSKPSRTLASYCYWLERERSQRLTYTCQSRSPQSNSHVSCSNFFRSLELQLNTPGRPTSIILDDHAPEHEKTRCTSLLHAHKVRQKRCNDDARTEVVTASARAVLSLCMLTYVMNPPTVDLETFQL